MARYLNFADLPMEEAERMTRVNWLGTLYTVQPALKRMVERGAGHVVVIASGAGFFAFASGGIGKRTTRVYRNPRPSHRSSAAGLARCP